jgi:hemerythrin
MRLFKWSKLHATYIPEIDAEHRTVFRLGDEFNEAVEAGAGAERLQSILQALIACAEDHFSHEERLMRAARYDAYEWHKQQHDGVRRRLQHFAGAIGGGDTEAPALVVEYLSDWIKGHTGLSDRMMAAALRNHDRFQALAS